jgi:hypothetical protein
MKLLISLQGRAILIQTWTGPEGSRRLMMPEFLDSRHMNLARLSALRTGRFYSFLLEAELTLGSLCGRIR